MMMTRAEVDAAVEEIRANKKDYEQAHAAEDALWARVLTEVAKGHLEADMLADHALRTTEIDFPRGRA